MERDDREQECQFCNLELTYEILKYVRSNCGLEDTHAVSVILFENVQPVFHCNLETMVYHCRLLARDNCFKLLVDQDEQLLKFIDLELQVEIRFQQIRGILGK